MTRILRALGSGPFVFFCDHASNFVPEELNGLGLPASELARHIGWDIGAAGVTETLSERFDSPAILCGTSRLVIDCNRQRTASDLIPEFSDGTAIPGNIGVTCVGREERIARWFTPYHDAIESVFIDRGRRGVNSIAVSIHSMTPILRGRPRPWQIALSSGAERGLTDMVLAELRRRGDVVVGDNEPYALEPEVDYSTPVHALRRGVAYVQVEFRQDEIGEPEGQRLWAGRLAEALVNACRRSSMFRGYVEQRLAGSDPKLIL